MILVPAMIRTTYTEAKKNIVTTHLAKIDFRACTNLSVNYAKKKNAKSTDIVITLIFTSMMTRFTIIFSNFLVTTSTQCQHRIQMYYMQDCSQWPSYTGAKLQAAAMWLMPPNFWRTPIRAKCSRTCLRFVMD